MTEETKLVVDAIASLGEAGITAFIVWLIVNAVVSAAKYTAIAAVPVIIVRTIMNAIDRSERRKFEADKE